MASPSLLALLLVAISTIFATATSNSIIYAVDLLLPQFNARFDNYAFATGIPLVVAPLLVAPLIYAIVRLSQLRAALERSVRSDALTGLLNRRGFFEHAQRIFEQADERAQPATVMMVDVDRFKDVNDTFGHAAGDELLKRIARSITEAIGSDPLHNVAARIGGDEFAVVLSGLDPAAAGAVANRICRLVGERRHNAGRETPASSVSVGVAMRLNREPLDAVMKAADEAAYRAKRSGRDRWEIAAVAAVSVVVGDVGSAGAAKARATASRSDRAVPAVV